MTPAPGRSGPDLGGVAVVRRLTPADAALWQALRGQALAADPAAFSGDPEDWRRRPLTRIAAGLEALSVFVAEGPDGPLGCALWTPDDDPAIARRRAWLEAVWVAPEARGRGLARRLIAAVAADAAAAGRQELWLSVGRWNRPARAAYAAAGFRPPRAGAAVPRPDRPDEILLMRTLEPPASAD